jgi:hypothetical protein
MLGAKKGAAQSAAPFGIGRKESERDLGPKRDGVEILAQIAVRHRRGADLADLDALRLQHEFQHLVGKPIETDGADALPRARFRLVISFFCNSICLCCASIIFCIWSRRFITALSSAASIMAAAEFGNKIRLSISPKTAFVLIPYLYRIARGWNCGQFRGINLHLSDARYLARKVKPSFSNTARAAGEAR